MLQPPKCPQTSPRYSFEAMFKFDVRSSSGNGDISQNVKGGATLCPPPAARGLIHGFPCINDFNARDGWLRARVR